MAKISTSFPVSGRVGGFVFRRCGRDVIMSRRPRPSAVAPSDLQLERQARFRMAASYAKAVYADPVRKEMYRELAQRRRIPASRLFGFIVRDHQKPPEILEIDTAAYQRHAGDTIRIDAIDDLEVVAVDIRISRLDDGTVLEQGAAAYTSPYWRYLAQAEAPAGVPLLVEVTAIDHADNRTTERRAIAT